MPEKPRSGTGRTSPKFSSEVARGGPLAVYSVMGGVVAVGIANAVSWWTGGNTLDWLALLVFVVLVSGWHASPILRWLSARRR